MTGVSFSGVSAELLSLLLGRPGSPLELLVTLAVVLIVMLVILFQTQVYFGSFRANAPVSLSVLVIVVGGVFAGVVATKCYVFPMMPTEWFDTLRNFLGVDQRVVEGILLTIAAVLLLLAGGCPITSAMFGTYQMYAVWSWVFSIIGAAIAIFGVSFAFNMTHASDHVGSSWKKADQQWRQQVNEHMKE